MNIIPIVAMLAQLSPQIYKMFKKGEKKEGEHIINEVYKIAANITNEQTPDKITNKIQNNPMLKERLKQQLQKQQAQIIAIIVKDQINARKRDVEIRKLGKTNFKSTMLIIISFSGIIFCVSSLIIWRHELQSESVAAIAAIAATFAACLKSAYSFEFGAQ